MKKTLWRTGFAEAAVPLLRPFHSLLLNPEHTQLLSGSIFSGAYRSLFSLQIVPQLARQVSVFLAEFPCPFPTQGHLRLQFSTCWTQSPGFRFTDFIWPPLSTLPLFISSTFPNLPADCPTYCRLSHSTHPAFLSFFRELIVTSLPTVVQLIIKPSKHLKRLMGLTRPNQWEVIRSWGLWPNQMTNALTNSWLDRDGGGGANVQRKAQLEKEVTRGILTRSPLWASWPPASATVPSCHDILKPRVQTKPDWIHEPKWIFLLWNCFPQAAFTAIKS